MCRTNTPMPTSCANAHSIIHSCSTKSRSIHNLSLFSIPPQLTYLHWPCQRTQHKLRTSPMTQRYQALLINVSLNRGRSFSSLRSRQPGDWLSK
ncbi:hypothetical protein AHF37_12672 [Paragonimus kellicotti]|nr:hypothetical protein AHF37_12672 [Paragonimus kellicotti]